MPTLEEICSCAVQGVDLIFYGDSIFWEYNGDNLNGPVTKLDLQRRAIFQGVFKSYSFKIMALPGAALIMVVPQRQGRALLSALLTRCSCLYVATANLTGPILQCHENCHMNACSGHLRFLSEA